MYELSQILARSARLRSDRRPYALATVVKIDGSTYRRPGARMLVDEEGRSWGTISGGCLEGEVAQRALEQMERGGAALHAFELGEDDIILGFGTGCNGIVHVLIEAFSGEATDTPLDWIARCVEARRRGVMATVLQASGAWARAIAQHALVTEDIASAENGIDSEGLHRFVVADARRILSESTSAGHGFTWQNRSYTLDEAGAEVLFEIVQPPIRLLVFGEGHDVHPVVTIARRLGWDVWIVGRKPVEILAERFPQADHHMFLMHPEEAASHIPIDGQTAVFVMNHNYIRDKALLTALLETGAAYIGLLGPRSRATTMLEELGNERGIMDEVEWERVYGPMGLDIGTETPEEIALAALAEVQAAMHSRGGGSLRHREGPIHEVAVT